MEQRRPHGSTTIWRGATGALRAVHGMVPACSETDFPLPPVGIMAKSPEAV
jgi:hypothetical protein